MSNTNKFIDSTQIKFYPSGYRGQVWLESKDQTYSYDPESKLNTEENVTRPYRALIQYNSNYNKHTKNKGDLVIGWEGNEDTTWKYSKIKKGSSTWGRPFIFIINGYYVKLLDSSVLDDVIADYPEAIYAHIKMRNYGIDDDKTLLDGDKFNVCLKARAATNLYEAPTAGNITGDNENDDGDSTTINYTDLDGTCTEPNTCFLGIEFVRKNDLPDNISVNDDFYLKVLERIGTSASNYDYRVPEQSRLILRTKDIFGGTEVVDDAEVDKNLSEYFNTNIIESYNEDDTPLYIKTRNNNDLNIYSDNDIIVESDNDTSVTVGQTLEVSAVENIDLNSTANSINIDAAENINAIARNTEIKLSAVKKENNSDVDMSKIEIKNDGNILEETDTKITLKSPIIKLVHKNDSNTNIQLLTEQQSIEKVKINSSDNVEVNATNDIKLNANKISAGWDNELYFTDDADHDYNSIIQNKQSLKLKSCGDQGDGGEIDLSTNNCNINLSDNDDIITIDADNIQIENDNANFINLSNDVVTVRAENSIVLNPGNESGDAMVTIDTDSIDINGATNINGDTDITKTLDVSGATTLKNTLKVEGHILGDLYLEDGTATFEKIDNSGNIPVTSSTTITGNEITIKSNVGGTTDMIEITTDATTGLPELLVKGQKDNIDHQVTIAPDIIQANYLKHTVTQGESSCALSVDENGKIQKNELGANGESGGPTIQFIRSITQHKNGAIDYVYGNVRVATGRKDMTGNLQTGLIKGSREISDDGSGSARKYYLQVDDSEDKMGVGYVTGIQGGWTVATADGEKYLVGVTDTTGSPTTAYTQSSIKYNTEGQLEAYSFYATSDKRLKENLRPLDYSKSILDLPVYKYDYINGAKNQIGCMAQDLQELYPELVHENFDGYLSVDNSKVVYLLLEEVKLLKKEIEELKKNR